jgi:hypothetical protein
MDIMSRWQNGAGRLQVTDQPRWDIELGCSADTTNGVLPVLLKLCCSPFKRGERSDYLEDVNLPSRKTIHDRQASA